MKAGDERAQEGVPESIGQVDCKGATSGYGTVKTYEVCGVII